MPVWASSGAPCEPIPGSVMLGAQSLRCLGGLWSSALCTQERSGSRWLREDSPVLREVSDLPGHIQPGEGLCCEPVRASRGLCHPGVSESVRGLALPNSQQTQLPVQQTTRWAWSTASPRFPRLFCLVPVVNSDRGAPAMSAAATGWKLEMLRFVFHAWFCCSVLLLLLEMNSCLCLHFVKKHGSERADFFFFHFKLFCS